MKVTINAFEPKNIEKVKELIDCLNEDAVLLNILKKEIYDIAYTAYIDSDLVGIIFTWSSKYHEKSVNFRLLSNPFYFEYEIEKKLLKKLEAKHMKLPLKTSIWETSVILKKLYEESFFKEMRRTYMPLLELEKIVENRKFEQLPDSYRVKTIKEIRSNQDLMRGLILSVKRNYEEIHKVDPITDLSLAEWQELIFAEDIVSSGSYVLLDEQRNKILAYTFLHESEMKEAYELGWCGSSDQDNKHLITHLVFKQIKFARKQNVKTFIGEFDTTDYFAMEVLKSFPFKTAPTWLTFIKY